MMNFVGVLDEEISSVNHLLESIPFTNTVPDEYFLNIYRLSYDNLIKLKDQPGKFPIDSNKMLKLGISLGNLIKTLQLNEDLYQQQQLQQRNFMNNLNKQKGAVTLPGATNTEDPFKENYQLPNRPIVITSSQSSQPIHHIKFVKNLVTVLKNFDIGSSKQHLQKHHEPSQSPNTINGTSTSSSSNASPIKLTSKQLLIEKLEINISLDTIFIYKIVFKLISKILTILRTNLDAVNLAEVQVTAPTNELEEDSSIFSSNSINSSESSSAIPLDEYLKFLKQIINRLTQGIIEPFYKLILGELVEHNIQNSFQTLINEL